MHLSAICFCFACSSSHLSSVSCHQRCLILFSKAEVKTTHSLPILTTNNIKYTAAADNTMTMSQLLNIITVFTVPTKGGEDTAPKKVIDTSLLKEEDLKSLKQKDPFLYFSIPVVRTAALLNRDVDMSSLQGSQSSQRSRRSRASCPSRIEPTLPNTTKVERRSCISFECYPDLLLEDFLDEMADDDEFDSMFRQLHLRHRRHREKQ